MTADMVATWCEHGADEINDASASPGVQTPAEMLFDMQIRLSNLNRVADRLYSRWIKGLKQ